MFEKNLLFVSCLRIMKEVSYPETEDFTNLYGVIPTKITVFLFSSRETSNRMRKN